MPARAHCQIKSAPASGLRSAAPCKLPAQPHILCKPLPLPHYLIFLSIDLCLTGSACEQVLDQALLRPGRFDRQVTVDRPDVQGRVRVLKVHSRGKSIGKDVDFDKVARRTPGEAALCRLCASVLMWL